MDKQFEDIEGGTITSPQGFVAGATGAGIKSHGTLDLALLYSQVPAETAGVFTTARIKSAPVLVTSEHLGDGKAQGIIVNSGCANACMGRRGLDDAYAMARAASNRLNIAEENVLVSSTGVIGVKLPLEKITAALPEIRLSREGGDSFARAIMTTDTRIKQKAMSIRCDQDCFTLAGAAKGAGMIHPNMATMLCYLTTDAAVEGEFLQQALKRSVDRSFNMITVDGDTSTSDTVIIMANGLAGNNRLREKTGNCFQQALDDICIFLAKSIARDGEGATRLIEVAVEGAATIAEARIAARTVACSPLVKAAVHGNDPNWGRIVAAIGRSGADVTEESLNIYINGVHVMKDGCAAEFDELTLSADMARGDTVFIKINLGTGEDQAVAWGCDLSQEYVTINSAYTT